MRAGEHDLVDTPVAQLRGAVTHGHDACRLRNLRWPAEDEQCRATKTHHQHETGDCDNSPRPGFAPRGGYRGRPAGAGEDEAKNLAETEEDEQKTHDGDDTCRRSARSGGGVCTGREQKHSARDMRGRPEWRGEPPPERLASRERIHHLEHGRPRGSEHDSGGAGDERERLYRSKIRNPQTVDDATQHWVTGERGGNDASGGKDGDERERDGEQRATG